MATRTHRTLSIMPTVDGRRISDLHHMGDVPMAMADEDLGRVVGACMRRLADEGISPGENLVTLEIRFA